MTITRKDIGLLGSLACSSCAEPESVDEPAVAFGQGAHIVVFHPIHGAYNQSARHACREATKTGGLATDEQHSLLNASSARAALSVLLMT